MAVQPEPDSSGLAAPALAFGNGYCRKTTPGGRCYAHGAAPQRVRTPLHICAEALFAAPCREASLRSGTRGRYLKSGSSRAEPTRHQHRCFRRRRRDWATREDQCHRRGTIRYVHVGAWMAHTLGAFPYTSCWRQLEAVSMHDVHAATEEFGKTVNFLPCGAPNPRRLRCQRLYRDLETAAVDFVRPCAFHAAIDEHHW
jgi:hypothetical protein